MYYTKLLFLLPIEVKGCPNKHNFPRRAPPVRTNYKVFVENLSSKVSWKELKDYMSQAGEVTYADAHR